MLFIHAILHPAFLIFDTLIPTFSCTMFSGCEMSIHYLQTFSASVLSGCMELSHTDVIYHFQMSAVSTIQGELVEGTLSSIDARTTIYVPRPGKCTLQYPLDLLIYEYQSWGYMLITCNTQNCSEHLNAAITRLKA